MTPRPRKEAQSRVRKLTATQVRSIAARLLDDMCANLQMIESFDDYDIDDVALSLREMLADESVAEGRKP